MPIKPELSVVRTEAHPVAKQAGGGHLLVGGVVGHKGGTGRLPNEYKAWCLDAVNREDVRARIIDELLTAKPFPTALLNTLLDRGAGKVESVTTGDQSLTITVKQG